MFGNPKFFMDMSESSFQRLRHTLLVERRLPYRLKHQLGWLGMVPNFLIIGAQKAGTTSLYAYLRQHPCVHAPDMRELHYFTHNFNRGLTWYKSQFPSSPVRFFDTVVRRQPFLSGESSPTYLLYPQVPRRVAALIPEVKLIALVRNPVDRAYSHYSMMVRRRFETLSFADAIAREDERTQAEWERAST
ncbi:MAG: sulfotransferase domain-containing protein, partial [Cyanobacteria bacterium J06648_11]